MPAGIAVAVGRGADWGADAVAGRAADGARAVPHPAVSAAISRPPHAAAKSLFIFKSPHEL